MDSINIRPPRGASVCIIKSDKQEMILLGFYSGRGSMKRAKVWAQTEGLKRTNLREVLDIGKKRLELYNQTRHDPMYLMPTSGYVPKGNKGRSVCWLSSGFPEGTKGSGPFYGTRCWFVFYR